MDGIGCSYKTPFAIHFFLDYPLTHPPTEFSSMILKKGRGTRRKFRIISGFSSLFFRQKIFVE